MNTKSLDDLALFHKTDKSSYIHNYCVKYEKYFPFKQDDKLKILEIGVQGGNSLFMWRDYYYYSDIIGIDINPSCKEYENDRIKVEIGDQSDPIFLQSIVDKYNEFDMVLDDGSHINSDVIYSFEYLFTHIKSGGIYVIEDVITSYWPDYGGGELNPKSTIEYFKKYIDDVNFHGIRNFSNVNVNARKESVLMDLFKISYPDRRCDIESINFLNSIIIITKR